MATLADFFESSMGLYLACLFLLIGFCFLFVHHWAIGQEIASAKAWLKKFKEENK